MPLRTWRVTFFCGALSSHSTRKRNHTGLQLIANAFREASNSDTLKNIPMDDKRPTMTVVNLLVVIFRCESLDENYNKMNAPDKKLVFPPCGMQNKIKS